MTKENLQNELLRLHHKFSRNRKSTLNSSMCEMWSTKNPPDVLSCTPQLEAIEEFVNCNFEEMQAIYFYDMNIKEATEYIWDILQTVK